MPGFISNLSKREHLDICRGKDFMQCILWYRYPANDVDKSSVNSSLKLVCT